MSYRREIPKLKRDNFAAWQGMMRLHLATISDSGCKYLDEKYKNPTGKLSFEDIAKKKNHNIMMIDIAFALSYAEFDEVKDCKIAHDMWTKLKDIYGGDENVTRDKVKSLRGHFYQMKMREHENIEKYVKRIKASVSAIKAYGQEIAEKTILSKVLRTLLPIYAIRVFFIQEMRCDPNCKMSLDALVGRLIAFELDNFDNYVFSSKVIESAFEAKLSLKKKDKKSKSSQS